jgi:hypothetical protein
MGQSTPIDSLSDSLRPPALCLVGKDAEGRWLVRAINGLTGGIFVNRDAAVKFATTETDHHPDAVILLPEHIKLSLAGTLPRL